MKSLLLIGKAERPAGRMNTQPATLHWGRGTRESIIKYASRDRSAATLPHGVLVLTDCDEPQLGKLQGATSLQHTIIQLGLFP